MELPGGVEPDELADMAFHKQMVRGFQRGRAEKTSIVQEGEATGQAVFGRQDVIEHSPEEELMSLMEPGFPQSLPIQGR